MVDEYGIGRGGHVIVANIIDKSKNAKSDIYTKLFTEAELSVQAAQELNLDKTIHIVIHLDYNSNENAYSNVLYSAGIGYVKGMGFEALGKPDAFVATHTADQVCKNKQAKFVPIKY